MKRIGIFVGFLVLAGCSKEDEKKSAACHINEDEGSVLGMCIEYKELSKDDFDKSKNNCSKGEGRWNEGGSCSQDGVTATCSQKNNNDLSVDIYAYDSLASNYLKDMCGNGGTYTELVVSPKFDFAYDVSINGKVSKCEFYIGINEKTKIESTATIEKTDGFDIRDDGTCDPELATSVCHYAANSGGTYYYDDNGEANQAACQKNSGQYTIL